MAHEKNNCDSIPALPADAGWSLAFRRANMTNEDLRMKLIKH